MKYWTSSLTTTGYADPSGTCAFTAAEETAASPNASAHGSLSTSRPGSPELRSSAEGSTVRSRVGSSRSRSSREGGTACSRAGAGREYGSAALSVKAPDAMIRRRLPAALRKQAWVVIGEASLLILYHAQAGGSTGLDGPKPPH